MPIDQALFRRAKKLDRTALENLLAEVYPTIYRIASALTGRDDVAQGTVRFVMAQFLRHFSRMRDAPAAERWFYHFTVLTSRRAKHHAPDPLQDSLVIASLPASAEYTAFIRSLRALPFQQREAILLHYGQQFDIRTLAIAMDCSTHAAEQHLQSASDSLKALMGSVYNTLLARMNQACAQLAPGEQIKAPAIRKLISKSLRLRQVKRVTTIFVASVVLLAVAYSIWRWRLISL